MAKVPRTSWSFEMRGSDQAARSPYERATSRDCAGGAPVHLASLAISEMMTRSLVNAYVPQAPMSETFTSSVIALFPGLDPLRPGLTLGRGRVASVRLPVHIM